MAAGLCPPHNLFFLKIRQPNEDVAIFSLPNGRHASDFFDKKKTLLRPAALAVLRKAQKLSSPAFFPPLFPSPENAPCAAAAAAAEKSESAREKRGGGRKTRGWPVEAAIAAPVGRMDRWRLACELSSCLEGWGCSNKRVRCVQSAFDGATRTKKEAGKERGKDDAEGERGRSGA